jgi:hypothetical protein
MAPVSSAANKIMPLRNVRGCEVLSAFTLLKNILKLKQVHTIKK